MGVQIVESAHPAERYRADIDGLRAVAVSSVVLFHAGLFPFNSGFVGVDIFFVISGYLIGGIIIEGSRTGQFNFIEFYARRARRILPALLLIVMVTCLLGFFLLDSIEFFFVGGLALAALLAISNFSFWRLQDYFAPDSALNPLLMTWSLGVEEQFYALFPFLIIAIIRVSRHQLVLGIAIVTTLSFLLSVWSTNTHPAAAFYLLPARAWELGVGALLAAWQIGRREYRILAPIVSSSAAHNVIACTGLFLVIIAIVAFDKNTPFPGFAALVPAIGSVALICARQSWINKRILSSRPMVFVGLISYSWYLWHWPLMSYLKIVVPTPPTLGQLLAIASISFVLAVLSWRFIEQPFRRSKLAPRATLFRFGAVVAVALAWPASIKWTNGLPQRLPEQTKQIQTVVGARLNGPCSPSWEESKPDLSSPCVTVLEGRPSVAVLGDSHAWALAPGLREVASQEHLGFFQLTKPGCPPLLGVSVWDVKHPGVTTACAQFMSNSVELLVADQNIHVVVLAGLWDNPLNRYVDLTSSQRGPELLKRGLQEMTTRLRNANKEIVLFGDTPYWAFDPLRSALADSLPLRRWLFCLFQPKCKDLLSGSVPNDQIVETDAESILIVRKAADHYEGVRYIDLFTKFCDGARCTYSRDGELLFLDKDHVSISGARHALKGFRIAIDAAPIR